jgi:7,8-dihydro-6-hydroxymethylpterin dimethyltransferase
MQRSLSATQSLCPECKALVPADVVEDEGRIVMVKHCPEHGEQRALTCSDAEWYRWSRKFIKPGRAPAFHATRSEAGCPYDCGFCPEHEQHACVTLFEITQACNLECPACFAASPHGSHASLDDIDAMLDAVTRAEGGTADVVMLSGGEPTIHPDFREVMRRVAQSGRVRHTVVNTNGIRFAKDPRLCELAAELNVKVYLQFDGFERGSLEMLRGKDLVPTKLHALDALGKAGVNVVLVGTIAKGVNDHEIGKIVKLGLGHPAVRAVSFQPQFGEGRWVPFDPMDRTTTTDVIAAVAAQTDGLFRAIDFVPIPCCDPMCTAATYAWIEDGAVTPLPRIVDVEHYLDYLKNAALPSLNPTLEADFAEMRATLETLYSKSNPAGSEGQRTAFECACGPIMEIDQKDITGSLFSITIEAFMDRWNFDVARARRCCIQEAMPDGRIIPFCTYNTLYRFAPEHHPVPVVVSAGTGSEG